MKLIGFKLGYVVNYDEGLSAGAYQGFHWFLTVRKYDFGESKGNDNVCGGTTLNHFGFLNPKMDSNGR